MRLLVPLLMLLLCAQDLSAQEQEGKLVDRLLKPNTALKNPAEGKQFVGAKAVSADKQVSSPSFSFQEKPQPRAFPDQRAVAPKKVAARHFDSYHPVAVLSTRGRPPNAGTTITPPAVQVQVAPENGTTTPTREFAGSRPFLAQGKSQKALRTKNKPLTIEQVRELLNKSK